MDMVSPLRSCAGQRMPHVRSMSLAWIGALPIQEYLGNHAVVVRQYGALVTLSSTGEFVWIEQIICPLPEIGCACNAGVGLPSATRRRYEQARPGQPGDYNCHHDSDQGRG